MAKNKAGKGNKHANQKAKTAAQKHAAAKSKDNAGKTAQPGIIASIMSQLTTAKEKKHPVTAADILASLVKQFPNRTETGMMITVRAQLSRLPKEKDFAINKVRDGRVVTYAAA